MPNAPVAGTKIFGKISIPNYAFDGIKYYKVVQTSVYAFRYCNLITSVIFPSTLEIIGTDTVWGTSITDLFIPKSVRILKSFAFSTASKLEKIFFEQGIKIIFESYVFHGCYNLNNVILPSSIYYSNNLFVRTNISFLYVCSRRVDIDEKNHFLNAYQIPSIFVTKGYKSDKFLGQNVTIMENEDYCFDDILPLHSCDCNRYYLRKVSIFYIVPFVLIFDS